MIWPIATNFSLRPDVSFRGEAEVGRAVEPAASVENDPHRKWGRFRNDIDKCIFTAERVKQPHLASPT